MPSAFDKHSAANNRFHRFTWGIEMTCEILCARDIVGGTNAELIDRLHTLPSPARSYQE